MTVSDPLGRAGARRAAAGRARRAAHGIRRVGPGVRAAPARAGRARPRPHQHVRRRAAARRPRSPRAPRRLVVGLGGSGTNDGGAGMLAALGRRAARSASPAAAPRSPALADDGLPGWPTVRERLRGHRARRRHATSTSPLLGLHGASAVVRAAEGRLAGGRPAAGGAPSGGFDRGRAARPAAGRRTCSAGTPRRLDREPGRRRRRRPRLRAAAPRRPRASAASTRCCSAVGLRRPRSAAADLVVTGEGVLRLAEPARQGGRRRRRGRRSRSAVPDRRRSPARSSSAAARPWRLGPQRAPTPSPRRPDRVEAAVADPAGTLADAHGPGGAHLVTRRR